MRVRRSFGVVATTPGSFSGTARFSLRVPRTGDRHIDLDNVSLEQL